MTIPTLLMNYLEAKARHAEARRLFLRAIRTTEKLTRRTGGSDAAWARACTVCGVVLADHRVFNAYHAMMAARAALKTAVWTHLRGKPYHRRLRLIGLLMCAELPAAANDPYCDGGRS